MGELLTLKPVAETIEFCGLAERKVASLIEEMIRACQTFMQATHPMVQDQAYREFSRAQEAVSIAQARVAFLRDVLDAANSARRYLWDNIPEGQVATLIVSREDAFYSAAMTVERKVARLNCSELRLFEGVADKVVQVA